MNSIKILICSVFLFSCIGNVFSRNLYAMTKGYDVPYVWYNRIEIIDIETGNSTKVVVPSLDSIGCDLPNSMAIALNGTIYISCDPLEGKGGFWEIDPVSGKVLRDFNKENTFKETLYPEKLKFDSNSNTFAASLISNGDTQVGILDPDSGSTNLKSSWMQANNILYDGSVPFLLASGIYWDPSDLTSSNMQQRNTKRQPDYQGPCSNSSSELVQLWYHWSGKDMEKATCSNQLDSSGKYATTSSGDINPNDRRYYVIGNPSAKTDKWNRQPMAVLMLNRWTGIVEDSFELPLSLNKLQSGAGAWRNHGTFDQETGIFVVALTNSNDDSTYLVSIDTKKRKVIHVADLQAQGPEGKGKKNVWAMSF